MSIDQALEQRVRAALAQLAADGLQRTLRAPCGVDFSSNDYLGLASHPQVKLRMAQAVEQEGAGSTGSRLLRGQREIFSRLERRFAAWKGAERALYFSSGYLANLAVLSTLAESGDAIFSDRLNHASLIDAARLSPARRVVFPHNDVDALARLMHAEPAQKFVVVESLFSMDGDFAPLREYADLCRETGAALIVDEAHATGIYGARGSGLVEEAGVDALITISTAGKALGAAGAFVAGPEWAIEYLIQRARTFVFSTAAPPAIAAAIDASLDLAQNPSRREELLRMSLLLRELLTETGVDVLPGTSQILSVILSENERAVAVATSLQAQGFDVRAIRPPTVPEGTARLRISVNTGLTDDILIQFASALAAAIPGIMRGVFVTGTDTGVGKTVVSAALASRFPQAIYWKPIQTGLDDDTAEVRRLSSSRVRDQGIRLSDPVSPHLAAARAGIRIHMDALTDWAAHDDRSWIVEGAGGVLVPVNESQTMATLMLTLGLPVVIAARSTLGTINHTLLTVEALRARSITIAGVVLVGDSHPDNAAAIEKYGRVAVVAQMPQLDLESLPQWAADQFHALEECFA